MVHQCCLPGRVSCNHRHHLPDLPLVSTSGLFIQLPGNQDITPMAPVGIHHNVYCVGQNIAISSTTYNSVNIRA